MTFVAGGLVGPVLNVDNSTSVQSVTVGAGGVPSGALICVFASKSIALASFSAVDSKSNTYTQRQRQQEAIDTQCIALLTSVITTPLVSGDTISVTFGGTFSSKIIRAFYFTATGAISFGASTGANSTFPHTSKVAGSLATTPAGSLVVAGWVENFAPETWTPAAGYTGQTKTDGAGSNTSQFSEYDLDGPAVTGTVSPTATVSTGSSSAGVCARFTEAAGAAGDTTTIGGAVTAGGPAPTVKVAGTLGGADTAGGPAPTARALHTIGGAATAGGAAAATGQATTAIGGAATAGGAAAATAQATTAIGGAATAAGPAPTDRAQSTLTVNGAVAAGASPAELAHDTTSVGGAVASGNEAGSSVVTSPAPGGAIAGGFPPSESSAGGDTAGIGAAAAGGLEPTVKVPVGVGGADALANSPTIRATVTIGGATAAGNSPGESTADGATTTPGGATAGGHDLSVSVAASTGTADAAGFALTLTRVPVGVGGAVARGFNMGEDFTLPTEDLYLTILTVFPHLTTRGKPATLNGLSPHHHLRSIV